MGLLDREIDQPVMKCWKTNQETEMSSIGTLEREWQDIQQEANLPRKIERYQEFKQRFQQIHAAESKYHEQLEQRLRTPTDDDVERREGAGQGGATKIAELWALLKNLESEIADAAKRAAQFDATPHTEEDPLRQAFEAWGTYEQVCSQLFARFDGKLDVTVHGVDDAVAAAESEAGGDGDAGAGGDAAAGGGGGGGGDDRQKGVRRSRRKKRGDSKM